MPPLPPEPPLARDIPPTPFLLLPRLDLYSPPTPPLPEDPGPPPPGVSTEGVRRLEDFPLVVLASGLRIHQEDFPVPSFWHRTKREWRDRLCRMEFWKVR